MSRLSVSTEVHCDATVCVSFLGSDIRSGKMCQILLAYLLKTCLTVSSLFDIQTLLCVDLSVKCENKML